MDCILSDKFISAGVEMCNLTDYVSAPYIRKNFELADIPEKALLSVCGLGFYEVYVNGINITKGLLSPYISNPDQVMDYDVYEVVSYLKKGKNTLAFILGNGMQNSFGGYIWDFEKAKFRSAPKLAVWFGAEYKNGESFFFEADESFVCTDSPLYYDDLRQGEKYDAGAEIEGWNEPCFDDSGWKNAVTVKTPEGIKKICEAKPIVKTKELKAVSIKKDILTFAEHSEVYEGWLYDFGENLSGIERLKINGVKGQHISMIFGENIGSDGHFSCDNIRFVRDSVRDIPLAIQMDEYTLKGGETEYYRPRFTYHGFRYALVSGITEEQATQDLLTYEVMNSDIGRRGGFYSSDKILSSLQHMTENSILANFFHFPTDCPHREKNGWTADASLSAEACLMNFRPEENYKEWLCHIRNAMDERGALPGIVPTAGWGFDWGNGPAWDQVLVNLVYLLYRFDGDKKVIDDNAEAVYRYCKYIAARRDADGLIAIGLGDWLPPHDPIKAPLIFTDSVISFDICSKAAFLFDVLGDADRSSYCKRLAEDFRQAIREKLIDFDTATAVGNCQTSQAMALFYGIFDDCEKRKAYSVLLDLIKEQDGHPDCGVLGSRVLYRVLADNGDIDLALSIISRKDAPSYGHWVERGETSLCEDFAPYEEHILSLNHHFLGDISAFFIEYLGGIRVNPDLRDVKNIDIVPVFPENTDSAGAYFESVCGTVKTEWISENNRIVFKLVYPKELNGKLILPNGAQLTAASGIYLIEK